MPFWRTLGSPQRAGCRLPAARSGAKKSQDFVPFGQICRSWAEMEVFFCVMVFSPISVSGEIGVGRSFVEESEKGGRVYLKMLRNVWLHGILRKWRGNRTLSSRRLFRGRDGEIWGSFSTVRLIVAFLLP